MNRIKNFFSYAWFLLETWKCDFCGKRFYDYQRKYIIGYSESGLELCHNCNKLHTFNSLKEEDSIAEAIWEKK